MAATVHILVVENDDVPQVREAVLAVAATSLLPVAYVQESQAGLCHARNRALDEALQRGAHWLAFIDDDEVAEPQWVAELYRVAQEHRADVVRGPVQYCYPPEDRWAHLRDTGRKASPAEGQRIREGATNNVLMTRHLFEPAGLGLRFDDRLNFTGGEDKLFFLQADALDIKMVFAPSACVEETVPLSRCSLGMLWRDKSRLAANAILIERDILGIGKGDKECRRQTLKECGTAFKQLGKALKSVVRGDGDMRRHLLKAWLAMARVQGTVKGLRRQWSDAYRHIQGH